MKWIVKSDFFKTPNMPDIVIIDAVKGASKKQPHPNHIHMGAIFELGTAKDDAEFLDKRNKDPLKPLIACLRYAGRIGDASDKEVVARVESDVAARNNFEAGQAKRATAADSSQILALFQGLAAIAQKNTPAATGK